MKPSSTNTSVDSSPDYVPVVGDVVEYIYSCEHRKGIIFGKPDSAGDLMISHTDGSWAFTHVVKSGFKAKVGHTDVLNNIISDRQAGAIAEAYFSQFHGSYKERQAQWVEHCGIKIGSKVKVVRKVEDDVPWNREGNMDKTVGKVGVVRDVSDWAIYVEMADNHWNYSFECLEPVK